MDTSYIVRKTEKGENEVKARVDGISHNLRVMLILVDGTSSVGELLKKAQGLSDVAATLKALDEQGYIEFVSPESMDYGDLKEALIRTVTEVLGDDADKFVKKLQDAPPTKDGLIAASNKCRKMVQLVIDEDKAEVLMTRCTELLGQH